MVKFDLSRFLLEKRYTTSELAHRMGLSFRTIAVISKRGTAKLSFIRQLEKIFGDCTIYIGQGNG